MFGDFPAAYHPTRADSFNKVVQVDGQSYNVDVLDTAGQESYAAVLICMLHRVILNSKHSGVDQG